MNYICGIMQRLFNITFVLIAVLAIFLEVEKTTVYTLWYSLDNDSFTSTYCLNLDRPELDCHGSCRLNAEVHNLDDSPSNPVTISSVPLLDVTYYFSSAKEILATSFLSEKADYQWVSRHYHFQYLRSVFHPPTV